MLKIVAFVVFLSSIQCQKIEGDSCTINESNDGTCTLLSACESAIFLLRNKRIQPKLCGFHRDGPLTCCKNENSTISNTTPVANNYKNDLEEEECAFPKHAITIDRDKSPFKAWNKCIDLADSVFPCLSSGFSLNNVKTRITKCAQPPAAELIFGGKPTKPDEFPHMAVLGYDNIENSTIDWNCGGTLISEDWVMTAAHCLKSNKIDVGYVRLGGGDLRIPTKPNNLFRVIRREKHHDHKGIQIYNDIALLQLDRTVTYSKIIRPACLHVGNYVKDKKVTAIGYGTMEDSQTRSDLLLKVELEKFDYEECSLKHPPSRRLLQGILNETQICYGSRTDIKDTCQGDSGAPLQIVNRGVYCTYTVIGITANGQRCGIPGVPAIYTRVSAYIPWIENIVWPN